MVSNNHYFALKAPDTPVIRGILLFGQQQFLWSTIATPGKAGFGYKISSNYLQNKANVLTLVHELDLKSSNPFGGTIFS